MTGNHKIAVVNWLYSGLFLVVAMVVIGGITRLTGSGLSMVEWQVISGAIPPLNAEEWEKAFDAYKQFPEYQKMNYHLTLSGFKGIFWWEYSHRLAGRITGLVFIIPFIYFLWKKRLSKLEIKNLIFILFLGILQGAMGWFMVKSGLINNPHVSHFRLAAHLSLALLLIGSIQWLILKIKYPDLKGLICWETIRFPLATLCLLLIFIQVVLGAFVAGLKSGYYHNTFPLMNSQLIPWDSFARGDLWDNGSFVQFLHRWFAWIVFGVVVATWLKIRTGYCTLRVRKYSNYLMLMALVQVILGISTLILAVPLSLGVAHQITAVILFSLSLTLLYHVRHCGEFAFT
ncbi:COX15/CtaA family protein [Fulvivirga sp. 29W222]|uniref:COX15/CtaA family protein n=1 Tax=Fulvivirga marina TaxID=2494733 RepID=A0A937G4X0_9BACT|nr:COX15/CtaA family protein [Fulvivirga marina]MBL6448496.1 COX15/CtaA family protein [Fulvivirga marina]